MFTLVRVLPWRRLLGEQMPAMLVAWVLAELFYTFHSFTLECAAFLATWFLIDAAVQALKALFLSSPARPDDNPPPGASAR